MDRVQLFMVVAKIADLVKELMGEGVDIRAEVSNAGAVIHIPPPVKRETLTLTTVAVVAPAEPVAVAQTAVNPPVVAADRDLKPAVPPSATKPVVEAVTGSPYVSQSAPPVVRERNKIRVLPPEELEAEFARLLEIAKTVGPEKNKTIDLLPWLDNSQVRLCIGHLLNHGFAVRPSVVWGGKGGNGTRFRYINNGVRLFVWAKQKRAAEEPLRPVPAVVSALPPEPGIPPAEPVFATELAVGTPVPEPIAPQVEAGPFSQAAE